MASQGTKGFTRLIKAVIYSWQGFRAAFRNEAAFRQELFLALILIPAAFWLGDNGIECALMVGSIMIVLIVELVNSGIEAVVDRFGGEHHRLSGRAKDIGSAAVLLSLINVVVVWGLVLFY